MLVGLFPPWVEPVVPNQTLLVSPHNTELSSVRPSLASRAASHALTVL